MNSFTSAKESNSLSLRPGSFMANNAMQEEWTKPSRARSNKQDFSPLPRVDGPSELAKKLRTLRIFLLSICAVLLLAHN